MRAVFDHSWRLLTESERIVLRQLSIFRGGFTRQAAEAVSRATLPTLRALVNKSLLQPGPQGRYEMHELLRQYAAEQLAQAPAEAEATNDRHSAYYCAFLQGREADLKGPGQQAALAEIEADGENARLAWQWAVERGRIEDLGGALESLALFYLWRGRLFEGEALCRLAAEQLVTLSPGEETGDPTLPAPPAQARFQVRLLIWLSSFNHDLRQFERAQQALRQAQTLLDSPTFASLDTRLERAQLLLAQAKLAMRASYEEARDLVEQSLALYRTLDDPWHRAEALDLLGDILRVMGGHIGQARRVLEECLTLRQTVGDVRGIARSLFRVGLMARSQGQVEESERLTRQSLALIQEIDDQAQLADALHNLAGAMGLSGKFAEGQLFFKEGLRIRANLGLPEVPSFGLGYNLMNFGQYQEAHDYLHRTLLYHRQLDDKKGVGYSLMNLGQIAQAERRYSQAQKLLQEGITVLRDLRDMHGLGQSLGVLGYAALNQNNQRQARRCIRENLQIAVETGLFLPSMTALTGVALLLADQGQKERAVELYALALQHGHVANSRWFEDVAGRQIAAVAETLPPEVVVAAQARGRGRDLGQTLEELLRELEQE